MAIIVPNTVPITKNYCKVPWQMELMNFIEDSARFSGCQFIISTHSPYLLALRGAKIYDFDENPVDVKKWIKLNNVRTYYDFFKIHENEF